MRVHGVLQRPELSRPLVRNFTLIAVAVVGVLNIGDIITTHFVLARHGVEANPLASTLLSSGILLWVKLALIGAVALAVVKRPPRVGVLLLAWFAAGVYAAAVLSNALLLRLT